MKLWYNGEKKESGFSPCVKKEKHLSNNKLTSSPIKKKSMSILSCGCALSLFFCVLPLDCISVSAAEPGQDAANEMIYGYVNSIPEYVDKVDGDIEAMTIIGSTLGSKFAVYYASLRLFEEMITSDEWDINVSDGTIPQDVISGYYKKQGDDSIYIGTAFSPRSDGDTIFQGSSGVTININFEPYGSYPTVNIDRFVNRIDTSRYYPALVCDFYELDSHKFYTHYNATGDSYFVNNVIASGSTGHDLFYFLFTYSDTPFNSSSLIFRDDYNNSALCLFGCGSWFVPPDNPPDWESIREMTKPQKEEYFKRYIPDVFNVYYKSVHPELEPYFIHFEPDEETPTDPNPPVNPDGSCCCCNHDIIINNNINNDWVFETQNLPDSPSIDLQIPTADFELLNPSEELETHGNAIALWFDVFNHLIDSFELQGFILMMCGLALAAFIVWRLG